ncbi:polyphosphate kinase 2 [Salinisphaera sp. LB1]|uniref:polyphosphate kinase 2 n=1 Tax=Salinisphaera sp. LB1 TaxID=2183911 RepID=UPI000D7061B6|nr:polyphosphate kinase 2 [Salinisphaera sp. LB1]AWN17217.1 UDP-galactose-lipid carrier transferase [Salinisphaera sp. LB1]
MSTEHSPARQTVPPVAAIPKKEYKHTLRRLQIELVKLQRHFIRYHEKILVIFEGRDAAGKDGTIKRIVQHLSPRETRVVALGRPSEADRSAWYFQRYVAHLPIAEEFVLFNRSWYNRAGVERVMGFCDDAQYEEFMATVVDFEHMLVRSGIKLFKYYLDISQAEQTERLDERRKDPLKQWKISPIDAEAVRQWDAYSQARNEMFARTHAPLAPWTVVRADRKRVTRLNVIKDLLLRLDYDGKDESLVLPNPDVVFTYDEACLKNGMIAA